MFYNIYYYLTGEFMIIRITPVRIFGLVFLGLIIFFLGFVSGLFKTDMNNKIGAMAQYTYREIDKNFGGITEENKKNLNIIGYIPFYKDMGFGIVLENNVKTIRVYK